MKKSRKLLTLLLAAALIIALLMGVVACNTPEDPDNSGEQTTTEEEKSSESLIVSNGKFASTTGSSYVKTASNWTLTQGSWAKSATGLTTGIVDVSNDTFTANKGAINADVDNPGVAPSTPKTDGVYTDTNALVISMSGNENNGSIFYVSSQVKVAKGTYYKLSIDVWTDLILDENKANDKRGAAIVISQGTGSSSVIVSKFIAIDTESQWQTYDIYIEGSNFEERTFYVQLWLGYGPAQIKNVIKDSNAYDSDYTVRGTAMFDNVVMEKIEKSAYDAALVNQYNVIAGATATERTNDMQKVYGVESDKSVCLSYEYLGNNFTVANGYSVSSTTTTYFTSAKVGTTANYTVIKGKEDIEDDSNFPSYTATTDPVGIFDMSKLYYSYTKDNVTDNYADAYSKVTSNFSAPDHESLGVTYNDGKYSFSRSDNPLESKALLVYHQKNAISGAGFQSSYDILIENNKYYAVSVWVYIWVPYVSAETWAGTEPKEADYDTTEKYEAAKAEYDEKYAAWVKYNTYYEKNADVKATLRLTGATTDTNLEAYSDGSWGTWQKVTLKVKGNELADRKLNLELWYGEGEWEDDTLYPGGCFFDNITIEQFAEADDINAAYPAGEIKAWETIDAEDYQAFGLNGASDVFAPFATDAEQGWSYSVVDNKTYVDMSKADSNLYAGIVSGAVVGDWANQTASIPALNGIDAPAKTFALAGNTFDYVLLNHAGYTASTVDYKANGDILKTKPNKFYRLSMWVNTIGLKGDGVTISLYDVESKSTINSSATQSKLAMEEWTEISFLMQASATESDEMYIHIAFGSGDIYTPASHTKGAIMISAITWTEVNYSEYSEAKGTYVKSFALTSSTSTGSSITNSDFSAIDKGNYDDEEKDEIFNADGDIIGVAKPSSWTQATEAYLLTAPALKYSGSDLTWAEGAKEITQYFVYNAKKELIKVIDVNDSNYYTEVTENEKTTRTYKYAPATTKYYYVRAIAAVGGKLYASPLSVSKNITVTPVGTDAETVITDNTYENAINSVKGGIVNADKFGGTGLGADFYPESANGLSYASTLSSNLLMLTTSYPTYFGFNNSSSVSLSAESYYRLSVWVKTIDGATASVTIKNSSNYLAVTTSDATAGDYVGYTGINTDGAWVRYDIYIATNLSTGSLTLELYLGNKYANNTVELSTDGTKVSAGTSVGTVYFDDVMLVKLADVAAYNKLVYGVADIDDLTEDEIKEKMATYGVDVNADGVEFTAEALLAARKAASLKLIEEKDATGSFYDNAYKFELVTYNKDSFDNFDKKDDSADNNLEALIGNESNSFTHYASSSVYNGDYSGESSVADNDYPNHVYGVYNKKGDFDELIAHMTAKDYLPSGSKYELAEAFTEEQIKNFLTTTYTDAANANNNNYLMMANITKPSTQSFETSSLSMAASSYYKITFSAKLMATEAGKTAEFRFMHDKTGGYWTSIQIQQSETMVDYTFYYANESTKSLSAYLCYYLGSYDAQGDAEDVKNLMAGILIVDDLSIVTLTEDEYNTQKAATEQADSNKTYYNTFVTEAEPEKEETPVEDEDKDEEEEEEKKINPQVWLIVSSVVIGAILVAVIVILLYRKLKNKVAKKLHKTKVDSNMPADFEKKQAAEKIKKAGASKKDIDADEYND